MEYLHEDAFAILGILKDSEENKLYKVHIGSELRSTMTGFDLLHYFEELEINGILKTEVVKVDYSRSFLDIFLKAFKKKVEAGQLSEAKRMADDNDLGELKCTLNEHKSIKDLQKCLDQIYDKGAWTVEGDFGKDIVENVVLTISKTPKTNTYFEEYLNAFRSDKLTVPKKVTNAKRSYFAEDFYRYKKQRQILLELLKDKIETKNPRKLKIEFQKELPTKKMCLDELLRCFVQDEIIDGYGYRITKEDGYHIVLDVNEYILLSIDSKSKTKLKLLTSARHFSTA